MPLDLCICPFMSRPMPDADGCIRLFEVTCRRELCRAWRQFPPACHVGHCPDEDSDKCPCEKYVSKGGYCALIGSDA